MRRLGKNIMMRWNSGSAKHVVLLMWNDSEMVVAGLRKGMVMGVKVELK
jgi:hypothetical protein